MTAKFKNDVIFKILKSFCMWQFFHLFSCSQKQQFSISSASAIDMMSEVDKILNDLTSDKQSQRRVWEWMQLQVNDGGKQESESQT